MNLALLNSVLQTMQKKMALKQMFLKLIDPSSVFDASVPDSASIPFVPILSDPHSFENIINLLYVIKKYDESFWRRGELFGSAIFLFFSL